MRFPVLIIIVAGAPARGNGLLRSCAAQAMLVHGVSVLYKSAGNAPNKNISGTYVKTLDNFSILKYNSITLAL